jgi:hypothetical protein
LELVNDVRDAEAGKAGASKLPTMLMSRTIREFRRRPTVDHILGPEGDPL